jgi:peptide/nickel transport system permease protein
MRSYILRRILLFIPTLFVITLLSFMILVNAPGDPVERMMTASQSSGDISTQSIAQREQRDYWSHRMGLDLPVFYFSMHSFAEPDTLFKIADKGERNALSKLISTYGDWKEIQHYYLAELQLEADLDQTRMEQLNRPGEYQFQNELNKIRFEAASLKSSSAKAVIDKKIYQLEFFFQKYSLPGKTSVETVQKNFDQVTLHHASWKNYFPVISFHPVNQYHRWLFGNGQPGTGLIRGDLGISYLTKQPVAGMIKGKIGWSLFFTLFSVILAYIVSIPVAIKAASKKNSRFDHLSSIILFLLYSLPTFWIATVLLMTFSNTDVLNIFPASGVKPVTGYPLEATWFEKMKLTLPYLILPMICYTYSSFAFLSRTLRVSMLEILSKDFIRTARAKGLSEKKVLWKHALKNSLLPVISIFANVFPFMIGGSVILESIFTIPGMGSTIYSSIDAQDYPMIVAVFTLTGLLTMLGYLFSDMLYAFVDPRISFSKAWKS